MGWMEADRMKVELDRVALFALASDTRLELLRALQNDRKTLAQLTEKLNVDKAAVHRHLKKLEEGGLVSKEDDHGFIYYSLTWKAKNLVSPGERTHVVVLLASALAITAIVVVLMAYVMMTGISGGDGTSTPTGLLDSPEVSGTSTFNATVEIGSITPSTAISDMDFKIGTLSAMDVSTTNTYALPYMVTFYDMDGDLTASDGDYFTITGITEDVTFYLIYEPTGEVIDSVMIDV
ncbi:MAG: winged helix-turn-helix domain-containing protein [Methanomassiliicoccales archaeon]|nr:winged helix-turn-helix domain-containing protein [Methanomassiliicoccales archaeon]